jgi:hypothetical protein
MKNQEHKRLLPATDSLPKPGEFLLGSMESRAAARARLQHLLESRVKTTFLIVGIGPKSKFLTKAEIGEWVENRDGSLTRTVLAPSVMSEEDALQIFGTKVNPLHGKLGFFGIHN